MTGQWQPYQPSSVPPRQQAPWDDDPAAWSPPTQRPPHARYHGQPYYQQDYQAPQYPPPQYQPPRRNPLRYAAYAVAAIVLLGGSIGVTVALRHHAAAAGRPLSCKQQYASWKNGAVHGAGEKLVRDTAAVRAAGASDDIKTAVSALKALGPDAAALQAYPMPACADPKGYWAAFLADMKAAGDNADSASGLGGLLLAEAPLKKANALSVKLSAELKRTAGVKGS